MLLKNVVGITSGLAINHFLVSDGLAFSATLTLGFAFTTRFAISALRLPQLANLASCFQLLSHSADSGVAGFSLLTDLSVALIWVELQQFRDYPASFVRAQMTAMYVCADDVVSRLRIIAVEVRKLRRNLHKLTGAIAMVAVEDFTLVADYRLMQAIELDVSSELPKIFF